MPASPPTRLLLVRHAETTWNAGERIQGQQDSPLSARGGEQAERLAERLAAAPLAAIRSSDLLRARDTAEPVAARHGLEVSEDADLREVYAGAWEGMTTTEIRRDYPEEYWRWREDSLRHRPPGGET